MYMCDTKIPPKKCVLEQETGSCRHIPQQLSQRLISLFCVLTSELDLKYRFKVFDLEPILILPRVLQPNTIECSENVCSGTLFDSAGHL